MLVHVWSEFGRRARENGSDGTDHGAGGLGLLIGSRVRGRMIGEFPGLGSGLDEQGNLRATADFRGVYSAILEQWLDTDAAAVIPGAASFARPRCSDEAGSRSRRSPSRAARAAASRPPASRMQVTSSEFEFVLSRAKLRQGRAIVELVNLGEDPHDLALRRNAQGRAHVPEPEGRPPGKSSISLRLYPGRYRSGARSATIALTAWARR